MARDRVSVRGGDLHRRPRPGRGAGAGAPQGGTARRQAGKHLHRGPARDLRARLRVPDVPRQRALRGALPARHLDRPAADRPAPRRDRRGDRGRRHRPRRHRQGQRPGALRAGRLRAEPVDPGHRALARMVADLADDAPGVRREEPDPDRQGQARRGALLGGREPAAHLLRGQGAGGPGRGSAGLRLPAHGRSGEGAGHAAVSRRSVSSAATRSASTARP